MYIFVPSYPSIFYALYITKTNDSAFILTNNENVKKLLIALNVNYIYYDFDFRFKTIINAKKKLDRVLSKIDTSQDLYLLDNTFAIDGFYFAAKWGKKGSVYFNNLSAEYDVFKGKIGFKNILRKFILEMVFGFKVVYRYFGNFLVFGIDTSFLIKYCIKDLPVSPNYETIKKKVISSFQIEEKKAEFLWVAQGQLETVINYNSLENILSELVLNYNFAIKEHPKNKVGSFPYTYIHYPDYIPCEFLLCNINKCILSVYSTTLIAASQFKHLKVVSLLELVDWCNNSIKEQAKHFLQKESGNQILFPKSTLELKKILN